MRVVPLPEIAVLTAGEVIPSVRGIVTDIYDQNSGTNATGAWSIQNMFLEGQGQRIKVKLLNRAPMDKDIKGQAVLIYCKDGAKGLSGVYAEDDEYPKGTVNRILKVTPSATIESADGEVGAGHVRTPAALVRGTTEDDAPFPDDEVPPPKATLVRPAPKAKPTKPPVTPPTHTAEGHGEAVRKAAHEIAQDYYRVMDVVDELRTAWDDKHSERQGGRVRRPMTAEHFQAACASVWIRMGQIGGLSR